jgi:hypothetical protein
LSFLVGSTKSSYLRNFAILESFNF